jgi:glycosyltransferase involved in cell wall biosynthesis
LKPGTTSPLYNALTSVPPGRALVEWGAERYLKRMIRRLGIEPRPAVLASNIYTAGLLRRLDRKLLLYDFNDHPLQFSATPPWAEPYLRRTLAQAQGVFVVSEYYRRKLASETDRPLILLGNGVETAHFEPPRATPPDLAALPRPRLGYVGLLSHFLDFEVLETLRRNRRGGTLVLIGPGSPATRDAVAEFSRRDGVALLGPKPYEDVPAYMQGLDVGLIPFRASDPYVQGINPNKVYQYLAAGRPVLTTPLLDLAASPPDLLFASGHADWELALDRVLEAAPDPGRRQALARPHDWGALSEQMVAEIERRLAAA